MFGTRVRPAAKGPTAYGSQLAAPDQADSVFPLGRWRGDVEDVGADGKEAVGKGLGTRE